MAARNPAHTVVSTSRNSTLARRRLASAARPLASAGGDPWIARRRAGGGAASPPASGRHGAAGRAVGDVGAIRELTTPLTRAPLRVSGRPVAAGRLSIDGASERPIERTATPRARHGRAAGWTAGCGSRGRRSSDGSPAGSGGGAGATPQPTPPPRPEVRLVPSMTPCHVRVAVDAPPEGCARCGSDRSPHRRAHYDCTTIRHTEATIPRCVAQFIRQPPHRASGARR